MATTTTRLGLRKPNSDPVTGDDVDVDLDLNANWDKMDAAVGAVNCTAAARPSSPYVGQFARETDTGLLILCTATGPAVWVYIITSGVALPNAGSLVIGDVNLYRSASNILKTDDALTVAGALVGSSTAAITGIVTAEAGVRLGHRLTRCTTLSTSATAGTYVTPTGFTSFALAAGKLYKYKYGLSFKTDTADRAARPRLSFTGTVTRSDGSAVTVMGTTVETALQGHAFPRIYAFSSTAGATSDYGYCTLEGLIEVNATGNLSCDFTTELTGATVSVDIASYGEVYECVLNP